MTDQQPAQGPRLRPRRVLVLALISAAVALALTLYLGNASAPRATECPAQPEAASLIDAAAVGPLAALNGTGKGRGYADIAFTGPGGKPMTIADFRGKKLLVNFWASWCIPCRAEMPALNSIAGRYNSEAFMVLPINTGEAEPGKGAAFLADNELPNLPLYTDTGFGDSFKRLQREAVATGLPATLLLDAAGCELAVLPGPAEWDTPEGENVVKALIGT